MANDWGDEPARKANDWGDAPALAASHVPASSPSRPLTQDEIREDEAARLVDKMPWLERQVTAFGEGARHAIRQGANLLGKVGVPGTPTDDQLLEESRLNAPLRASTPAYGLGGASLAVPPAVAAGIAAGPGLAASTLASGATGAVGGGVFSDPGQRAHSALAGGALGVAVPLALAGAGAGLGALGRLGRVKAGEAVGEAATKKAAEAAADLASETGRLGGLSQDMNRKVEWVIRLLDEEKSGTLSAGTRQALEAFRQTPEYAAVMEKAAQRVLQTAPGSVARTTAQEAKVGQMTADLPQTVANNTSEAVSRDAALDQIKARLLRYGLPALGGAMGLGASHGVAGAGIGALAGAGMRPMMHSLIRMAGNPAVRNQTWSALGRTGEEGAKLLASPGGAAALSSGTREAEREGLANYLRSRIGLSAAGAGDAPESAAAGTTAGASADAPRQSTPAVSVDAIASKLSAQPRMGHYADLLRRAGPGAPALHFELYEKDPTYRAAVMAGEQKP